MMRCAIGHILGYLHGVALLCVCATMALVLMSAAVFSDEWSGRFLGVRLASGIAAADAVSSSGPSRTTSEMHKAQAPSEVVVYERLHVSPGSEPTFDLTPHGGGSVFVEDNPEQDSLGLGWAVDISPGFQLRGSVSGQFGPDGEYSLSPEHRQLGLTASFRF